HGPALLRQMRHHRTDKLDEDFDRLAQGPAAGIAAVGGNGPAEGGKAVGELVDMGDRAIETQALDVVIDRADRLVSRLAQRKGSAIKGIGPRAADRRQVTHSLADQAPYPLDEAMGALHARLGPDDVALG